MNDRFFRRIFLIVLQGVVLSASLFFTQTFAADGTPVACSAVPNSNSCNQCFNGGALYAGWQYPLYDIINNATTDTQMIMYRDNRGSVTFENLQYGLTDWNYPSVIWQEPSTFSWRIG